MESHGPFVGGHDWNPAPKRLPHVRDPGLAAVRGTRGHLNQNVGFGRGEPFCAARPVSNSVELSERPSGGCKLENGLRIDATRVVNESIPRVGDAHDLWYEAVPVRESRRLRVHRAHEPLPDRSNPTIQIAQLFHRADGAELVPLAVTPCAVELTS